MGDTTRYLVVTLQFLGYAEDEVLFFHDSVDYYELKWL